MKRLSAGTTRAEALKSLRRALTEAGFETAAIDARLLLLFALGIEQTEMVLRPDERVSDAQAAILAQYLDRRLRHEPVARILGEREFWGLPFALSPETLVPRPDTETLVETVLDLIPDRNASFNLVDFGTGSGCILTALLHERPKATGLGIDLSFDAIRTARRNAWRNGVGERASFLLSHWGDSLAARFDLIVSNPPYIASPVIAGLDREVREHDPALALDGGPDGLDAYRILVREAGRLLTPKGLLVLEIGFDQADALRHLGRAQNLELLALKHDLGDNPRCVAFRQA